MLQVIAGYDPEDTTTVEVPVGEYVENIAGGTSSLRMGVLRSYFYDGLHPEIQAAMEAALTVLKNLTASYREAGPLATDATYSSIVDPCLTVLRA